MGKLECSRILATMWDNFIPRVDKICEFYGITKQSMAEIIGTAQSSISTPGVHYKDACRILVFYPDINARWLLFGDGDMMIQKEAEPHKQPDPAPEGVTLLDKEGQVYKYLYEMKDKECQLLTRTFAEEIGKLKRDNDHLTAKLRELSAKPYRTDEETPSLMAAESTDNNN